MAEQGMDEHETEALVGRLSLKQQSPQSLGLAVAPRSGSVLPLPRLDHPAPDEDPAQHPAVELLARTSLHAAPSKAERFIEACLRHVAVARPASHLTAEAKRERTECIIVGAAILL